MHLTLRRNGSRPTFRHLLVATAAVAAGTVTLVAAPLAHAANPTLNAPERVYTGVGQTLNFTGSDTISGDLRTISMPNATITNCDTSGPAYVVTGCARLQITLNDQSGGKIFIPGNHVETQQPSNQPIIIVASGAIIEVATEADGSAGYVYHLSGNKDQINNAVATLQYLPAAGFESGADVSPFANLHLAAVNGSNMAEITTKFVEIRIEGPNGTPTLDAPLGPLKASTNQATSFPPSTSDPAVFVLKDPEMCTVALCGSAPNNSTDSDDNVLLVASLTGCTNSTFQFRGGAFTTLGSPTLNTVHLLLTTPGPGLGLTNAQAAPIELTLGAGALVPLGSQAGGPLAPTAVFAGVGEFDEVQYALSQVTFDTAETDDTTCAFNLWASDLGNNGMPLAYIGSPIGGIDMPQPGRETPDAKAVTKAVTVQFQDTKPDVTITPNQSSPTKTNPLTFGVAFSEAVDGLAMGDFTVSGGSVTGLTGSAAAYIASVTPTNANSETTIELSLTADQATATTAPNGGNDASNTATVQYDGVGPAVTIDQAIGQGDPTSGTPVQFTVQFGESVTGFDAGDVSLATSTAGASNDAVGLTKAVIPIDGDTYTVNVAGMATNGGKVIATVNAGAVTDSVTNPSSASTSSDNQVTWQTVDNTPPTVTIDKKAGQADPTDASPITFRAQFSEPVTGLVDGDVQLTGSTAGTSGGIGGLLATVTAIDADTYDIAVTGMSVNGNVVVSLLAGAAIDPATNPSAPSVPVDNSVAYVASVDVTPPTVTIDKKAGQADPTNGSTITFRAEFSESVTGLDGTDVDLAGSTAGTGGGIGGLLKTVTPIDADTYDIAVTGMSVAGNVVVSLPAGAAFDMATIPNPSMASSAIDNIVAYATADVTKPTATISHGGQADPTNSASIYFTVTFSESIDPNLIATTDFSTSGTAPGAAVVGLIDLVYPSTTTFKVRVDVTGPGTVILNMPAGGVMDGAGNTNEAAVAIDNNVTYDNVAPTATIVKKASAPAQADPTNASPIRYTVTFSEPVTGFGNAPSDVTLAGTAGATTAAVSGGPSVYTVTVTGMTGSGTVIASIPAGAGADTATNGNVASATSMVTYDVTAPTVTVLQKAGQSDPDSTSPIEFTVTFDSNVTGFTGSDLSFTGSSAGGTLVPTVTGGPQIYNVSVAGMTTSGNVIVSLPSGRAFDLAGNGNTASVPGDNVVAWVQPGDLTPPSVTVNQGANQVDPTTGPSVVFDVLFSEAVTGFTNSDVSLGGTAAATTKVVGDAGDANQATYTITVTGMTASGTVTASIVANGAKDLANNNSLASTSTDNTVNWTLDSTKPSVTVEQAGGQADPTNVGPIVFTATFTEPVTGFTNADVTLGGTAGATTAAVTGGPTTYTINVTGMTTSGAVTASIPAGAASDAATNTSNASTSADNSVTYDAAAPTVTINQTGGQADPATTGPISFTATFSEAVTGFTNADVQLGGTAGATTAAVTGGPTVYTVAVSGMTQPGTVTATIPAAAATDSAGNGSAASTSSDNTVAFDGTAPTVTINQAGGQADPTTAASIEFTATFSEAISGFTNGDVTLGGTAGATTAVVNGGPTVFTVTVSGMTSNGTVTAAVNANAATDGAGNTSAASTSSDNTVNWLVSSAPLVIVTPGGPVSMAVSAGSQLIFFTTTTPQVPPPPGVLFPYGQMSFSASTTPGGLVTFTMTLPDPATAYYKLVFNGWLPFDWDGETGAQLNGTTLTITIRDNGRGDTDLTPGIATDPGAIGVMAELPATGSDSRRLLWPAAMFVAAGIVLLYGQRRRRPAEVRV